MSWIRHQLFRLKALFGRRRIESELDDEIRAHLEMASEAKIALGMSPEEARNAARREFGGIDQVKEAYRDERMFGWVDQLGRDVRMSVRTLWRAKAFSLTVLVIIAMCLGANIVIFSVVNGALLRPLPFHDPERLVVIHDNYPKAGLTRTGASAVEYLERKAGITAFVEMGAFRTEWLNLNSTVAQDAIEGAAVTPSFFRVLGMDAAIGRTFTTDEGLEGKAKVVVISDDFWRERFNGDAGAIGKQIRIEDVPYTVVGIMPPNFHYLYSQARIWRPMVFSADDRRNDHRHGNFIEMVGRLLPGATIAMSQAELEAVNKAAEKVDPMAEMVRSVGFFSMVSDLHSDHISGLRPVLLLLQTGVLFLLLIGVVNLANLFTVRATGRAKEYSLRRALGAGQIQLAASILSESLILSLAGGLLGLALADSVLRAMSTLATNLLPADMVPELDWRVCLVSFGTAVALGMTLAAPSIWFATGGRLASALAAESRGGTTTRSVHRLRHTLIVVQIALCLVLISGTGLLALSFARIAEVQPGFRKDNVLTGQVLYPWWSKNWTEKQRMGVRERILDALRTLPGADSATISTGLPFISWSVGEEAMSIAGTPGGQDDFIKEGVYTNYLYGDYFAVLGIPLIEGRLLSEDDERLGRTVVVVDDEFARRHWPKGGAVGSRIVRPHDANDANVQYFTIVGVVGTIKQVDLADQRPHATGYFPMGDRSGFMVSIRTSQAPEAAASSMRAAVLGVDKSLLLYDVKPIAQRIDESLTNRKTPLALCAVFGGASLVLAAVGIYGVLAYSVAQRRREIGVRMALGALPAQIMRQFMGVGLRLLIVSLPVGLVGALIEGRAIAGQLYGVESSSPLVLSSAVFVLVATALPACIIPSLRAAAVAPNEALRSE